MSSLSEHDNPNRPWRSPADLNDSPEFRRFLAAEFPATDESQGISRRRWLQLMGASLALAGVSGCRWEKAEILPFAERPPERIPGKPQRFATAMDLAGSAVGLMVTCVDGRPIKIEGNPNHPASLGATDVLAQAAILELYDPDRSQAVYQTNGRRAEPRNWDDFARFARSHFAGLRESGGAAFHVLAEADSSLTLQRLRGQLLQTFPQAKWHEYEPISCDNHRVGTTQTPGPPARALLQLDKARVMVCLDADPLGSHPAAVRHAADFAEGREVADGKMSRLYVLESRLSLTGAAADHRLAVPCRDVAAFARALEHELDRLLGSEVIQPSKHPLVRAMARDLVDHRSEGVVVCGRRQPADVQAAVRRINAALENVGQTVTYIADHQPARPSHVEAIRSLAADLADQKVRTLLILGGNPVYNAPADLDFARVLSGVETSIHLSLYRDETSRLCNWHLPRAHFLETWGDARAYDATWLGVVQPMIAPLFQGKSCMEVLAAVLDQTFADGYDLVRETFQEVLPPDDWEKRWRETLHDGLPSEWALEAGPDREPDLSDNSSADAAARGDPPRLPEPKIENGNLEIVFCQDASVYDGRFANNGWLQEWPDPITRLTWGNAALLSPATAQKLGVEDQTLVTLKYKGRELEIPAHVTPGQADGSVAVSLGYGRTAAGRVGGLVGQQVDPVGADAYKLRTSDAMDFDTGLFVEPTGKEYPLAGVQDHFAIDAVGQKARSERVDTLIREATLEYYRRHPDFAKHAVHHPPLQSLWEEHKYDQGYQWGMTIDLSKCTGCGACVVACQAENNIPIVGKQRVLQGREMQWLRVDRYFQGDPVDPQVVMQPVACQHCEMAPCEQVCPVAATLHDQQGLNVMVYNRCVGTRYCANNCPYKVRRFNYFNYHKELADSRNEIAKMLYNPEVTVRSRGIMEKCTYCLQRIRAATIEAKNNRRRIEDGELKTACQQVCPTRAIVFGDLSDNDSQVARWAKDQRSYAILAQLNVKPRTMYLARIRNPNPELWKEPT